MAGLHVVALISGGKDSLFSILHCHANGHQVVALANLHPPHHAHDGAVEDLDSYMYQTIGHAIIPLYEQALGLPLYRLEISGTAINKDRDYSHRDFANSTDEAECLLSLLHNVKQEHPEINAVSTGAILSDYQRTRVESVALRLGLTPLSYLWQWPSLPPHTQESLLDDMSAIGQDARIVKVASGGLDESFLWQNVADRRTISRLAKSARRFGTAGDGAILGEGGEYETIALSGPSPLWKGRIEVTDAHVCVVPGDAGSASVRISKPEFAPDQVIALPASALRIPPTLDALFCDIREGIMKEDGEDCASQHENLSSLPPPNADRLDEVIMLNGISGSGQSPREQTKSIMDTITLHLQAAGHSIHDIACSIIVLRDMSDFGAVNEVYGSYFTKPNPPARITIACADVLSLETLLTVSITSVAGAREGLHVQSRSYWAPANIGPYSQAIKLPANGPSMSLQGAVFVAGQIPLIPSTMELPTADRTTPLNNFAEQVALSLQHLHRIGRVMGVTQWLFGIAFMSASPAHSIPLQRRAKMIRGAWAASHQPTPSKDYPDDDSEVFDVWDRKHGSESIPWRSWNDALEDQVETLAHQETPPLVVIQVDSLPRAANVEWVGYGTTLKDVQAPFTPSHLHSLIHSFQAQIVPSG